MAFKTAGIIGAGIMGEAMINALIRYGIDPKAIIIREKRTERSSELINRYRVSEGSLSGSEVILLAVKPQDLEKTLSEIRDEIQPGVLLISLLAGVKIGRIEDSLSEGCRVVRVMPNTPILLGAGMSAICGGKSATSTDLDWVCGLLSSSGSALIVTEELMDAVTATSGSGPAYVFSFVEAMTNAAERLGLSKAEAKTLVVQTLLGAAKMVNESGKDPKTLRENVTSPNGTTAAALAVFDSNNLHEIVYQAMLAAKKRSEELSN